MPLGGRRWWNSGWRRLVLQQKGEPWGAGWGRVCQNVLRPSGCLFPLSWHHMPSGGDSEQMPQDGGPAGSLWPLQCLLQTEHPGAVSSHGAGSVCRSTVPALWEKDLKAATTLGLFISPSDLQNPRWLSLRCCLCRALALTVCLQCSLWWQKGTIAPFTWYH